MSLQRKIYELERKLDCGHGSMSDADELATLHVKLEIQNLELEIDLLPQDGTLETLNKKSVRLDRIIELKKQIGTWQK